MRIPSDGGSERVRVGSVTGRTDGTGPVVELVRVCPVSEGPQGDVRPTSVLDPSSLQPSHQCSRTIVGVFESP